MQLDPDFVDAPPRPAPSTGAGSEPGHEPETFPSETAEQRLATAQRLHAGLIVMSTHGRRGMTRLLYGSVAEAVVRAATVPVLLVPERYAPAPAD